MSRASRTGIKGLYIGEDGRARIDLRYTDPATGREERYKEILPKGTRREVARERGLAVLNLAMSGKLTKRAGDQPETLGPAFERYLAICETNGQGDPKYKQRHRDRWLETLGAGFRLDAFSDLTIERHKRRRREAGKAAGTINRELVTAKHFLNRCVEWGWLARRPKIVLLAEPPPRVRWLTDAEREALAAELDKPSRQAFRRVVAAALLSGQRLGKIIGLRRADVDLKARTLTISDMRKGGKRKTTHVPISDDLAAVLREALADSQGSAFVFVAGRRRKGGGARQAYTRSGVSTFFARVVDAALIEDFHFHDLRHDFATRLRRGRTSLDVLQALLGHSSPAMTQRYAHIGRDELAEAVASAKGLGAG
jgi:integrase